MAQANKRKKANIDIDNATEKMVEQTERVYNVSQVLLYMTEDKVRLCLTGFLNNMESRKEWLTPLGVFLTTSLALTTTDFKSFIIPADTWRAIFIIASIASLIWMIILLIKRGRAKTIDDMVAEFKHSGSSQQQTRDNKGSIEISTPIIIGQDGRITRIGK